MKNDLKNLRRSCLIGRWIMTVIAVLGCVGILVVLGVYAAIACGKIALPDTMSLSLLGLTYTTDAPKASLIAVVAALVCLKLGLYIAITWMARGIFAKIGRDETPFDPAHAKVMRRIAVMMLIASFINTMTIQIGEWAVAAVIWVIAQVFDYGCILQRESDETL